MPIHIKCSGGVQEKPIISVNTSGKITATAGDETTYHLLSNSDDSDFVEGNIKSGTTVFGLMGSYKGEGALTEDFQGQTDANGEISFYVNKNVGEIAFLWIGILTGSASNQYDSFVYSTFTSSLVDFEFLKSSRNSDYLLSNGYPELSVSASGRMVTISELDASRKVKGSIVYVPA